MTSTDVEAFMKQLKHPFQTEIARLRMAIMAIDPRISEEIKWNAPSFKLDDHFATFKLYPSKSIQIVLHTGAKPKKPKKAFALDDQNDLLEWRAIDRCVITLETSEQAAEMEEVVVNMVKAWIQQL